MGRIEFVVADLLAQDVDALVNPANERLSHGAGLAAVIACAAGPELVEQSRRIGHCPVGGAVVTSAGALPQRAIIHVVGPVWRGGESGEAALLAACHRAALARASEYGLRSIAVPAISTGIFGYPAAEAARVAVRELAHGLQVTPRLTLVRLCFLDPAMRDLYRGALPGR